MFVFFDTTQDVAQVFMLADGQAEGPLWQAFVDAVEAAGGHVRCDGTHAAVVLPRAKAPGRPVAMAYDADRSGLPPNATAREVLALLEAHDTRWGMDVLGCSRATLFRRLSALRGMPDGILDMPYAEAIDASRRLQGPDEGAAGTSV